MAEEDQHTVADSTDALAEDTQADTATLSIEHAIARLSLSRANVYRLVKDGVLKAHKFDAAMAFSECDVAAAAADLAMRRKRVGALLQLFTAKLAEHGIDDLPYVCVDDIESGVGEVADRLLLTSMAARASDFHVMPVEDGDRLLQRDGDRLQEIARVDCELGNRLKEKIKALASLAEAESGSVGAAIFRHSGERLSAQVRLSVVPTLAGEHIHLQFLHSGEEQTLESLGYTPKQSDVLQGLLSRSPGLYVLAGCHDRIVQQHRLALADYIGAKGKLVVSIDRARNYQSESIVHLDGSHAENADSVELWHAAMRLGPDAVLVDCVADSDQVECLIGALAAGASVLVQVSTATSVGALRYLSAIGMGRSDFARYLRVVSEHISVPQLCQDCKASRTLTPVEAEILRAPTTAQVYAAAGCDHCEAGTRGSRTVWGLVVGDEAAALEYGAEEAASAEKTIDPLSSDTSLASALRACVLAGDADIGQAIPRMR